MAYSFHEQFKLAQAEMLLKVESGAKQVLLAVADRLLEYSVVGDPSLWKSPAPAGYVPGKFKGSWHHSLGAPSTDTSSTVDATGDSSRAEMVAGIQAQPFGDHFFTNNEPYAMKLERGEHSSQTPPGGIVGRTEIDFPGIVRTTLTENQRNVW